MYKKSTTSTGGSRCRSSGAACTQPSLLSKRWLNPYIDFVVSGEAEITLPKLLLGIIAGVYPEKKLVQVITPARLDVYEPNWDGIDVTKFLFPESHSVHAGVDSENSKQNIFYYLISSRGCTYKCNFCWEVARTAALRAEQKTSGTTVDLSWRSHSLAWVKDQLDIISATLAQSGRTMDGVGFWDDMIFGRGNNPAHLDRAHSILSLMRERSLGYLLEARAGQLVRRTNRWNKATVREADLYRFLKETGCMQVFVGMESGSQATLNMIQKGTKVSDYRRLVELSHQVGLPLRFSMIVGFPNETDDSVNQTFDLIEELEEELFVSVSGPKLFTPYPGVPQFDAAVSSGLVVPSDTLGWAHLDRYADYRSVYPWLEENLRPATLQRIDTYFESVSPEKKHVVVDEKRIREMIRGH